SGFDPLEVPPLAAPRSSPSPTTTRPPAPPPTGPPTGPPTAPDDEPTAIRPSRLRFERTEREPLLRSDAATGGTSRSRGRIGKYDLEAKLGKGAFGVVYTARDLRLERRVALKVLRPTHLGNQEIVHRFLREARATARIAHPGIVTIHDCGMIETRRGPTAFIAMELLAGESLAARLARCRRLAPEAACEIARQIASALEAAHQVDVLHRDLKPDNVFLVPDPAMPSGERVKVLDFGLAKLGAGHDTRLQTVLGTPRYMSPEQSRSAAQVDPRSDIYSLGCILFELVAGGPPFEGEVRQLIDRHQRAAPPRAASRAPEVPPVLDDLVAAMLAKDPGDRPESMAEVQRALRRALDECAAVPPPRSVDISLSSLSSLAPAPAASAPPVPAAPSSNAGTAGTAELAAAGERVRPAGAPSAAAYPPGAPSGELLVASPVHAPEMSVEVAMALAPSGGRTALYVCALAIAVLAAIGLAVLI
ncbi:MAG TPA: serine/threonine-protein kinase, partial [Kofleriaceae bacterium]|nr:serine/threonine-protein kinase [Kofleriaceae bacterium]